jgi:predicted lipid-binding transport protein (Tim44 family)
MTTFASRRSRALFGVVGVLALLAAGVAEARPGGGRGSFGSRGTRTFDAPPVTRTAPNPAQPMERTQTPQPAPNVQRPGTVPQTAQPRGFGFGSGLFAGLLGAGLLGMLFGNGFLGGLAGLASFLGLLLQIALIAGVVWLAVRFFRRRQEPAMASARGPMARSALGGTMPPVGAGAAPGNLGGRLGGLGSSLGGSLGGGAASAAPRTRGRSDEVGIGEADYAAFERSLQEVTAAYSRQDVAALWDLATPEMAGYLQEELNEKAREGVVNTSSDVRLLQGDLAEAWREGETDYATVAMRFAMKEVTRDKATGRVVAGDPERPIEAAELWTFRRDRGAPWRLSAIQQTA